MENDVLDGGDNGQEVIETAGKEGGESATGGSDNTDPFADINSDEDLFQWQKDELIEQRKASIAKKAAKSAAGETETDEDEEEELSDEDKEDLSAEDKKIADKKAADAKALADKKALEAKKEEESKPRTHQIKIDGKVYEVDDDELKRGYQLAKASQNKINEAAGQIKQANMVFAALERGEDGLLDLLEAVYKDRSHEVLEKALAKRIEVLTMSPEKRRAYELQIELDRRDARDKEMQENEMKQHQEAMVQQYQEVFSNAMEVIIAGSGLPKNAIVSGIVIKAIEGALEKNVNLNDPKILIPYVQKQWNKHRQDLYAQDPEEVVRLFGEEQEEKWRQHLNKKYDGKATPKPSAPKDAAKTEKGKGNSNQAKSSKHKTWDEWSKAMDDKLED